MKINIPPEERSRTRSNIVVLFSGILLFAVILYFGKIWGFIVNVVDAAMPFLIGFALAILMLPVVNKVEGFLKKRVFRRREHPKLARTLSVIAAYILLLSLLLGFFAILLPQLVASVKSILQYLSDFVSMNSKTINDLLVQYNFLSLEGDQVVVAWGKVLSQLFNYGSALAEYLMAISGSIYTTVFQLFVGLVAAFYLLMDKERFCAHAKKVSYALFKPTTCERLIYWTRRANRIFAGFVTGKILDSLIIGLLCYFFMRIFKMEFALLISVIVGMTNVIPFFGPFIGAIPSIIILLLVNPMSALWFLIFIIILQQLDGNLIGPLILGDYVGLSPFWIMLSIVVGGALFGFVGMLLSVPAFALLYAIARTLLDVRLSRKDMPTQLEYYETIPPKEEAEKKK